MKPLSVVCLNTNNYLGRGGEYVEKLYRMVSRHLQMPFSFECLTERDISAPGWWGKLELVRRSYGGWVLYLDLDVVITASLDELVEYPQMCQDIHEHMIGQLWMRDDFSYSIMEPRQDLRAEMIRTLGGPGCCNSSVMMWYDSVALPAIDRDGMHGDQNVLTAALWPDRIGLIPKDLVKSYKYHPGELAPIVVFHGDPKMHTIPNDPIVAQHWK